MSVSRILLLALFVLSWVSISPPSAAVNRPGPAGVTQVCIVVFGDSLAAGYGLVVEESFPRQLEGALAARGIFARVLNHGVSGDTSAGGRQRVEWMLRDRPQLVIVELGANDALRGLSPEAMEDNLGAILIALKQNRVAALLAGMRAPPNLGREYAERFNAVFPRLAEQHKVPLYPFFLEGVAGEPHLNQDDGMHPNAAGVAHVVREMLPLVEAALASPQEVDDR